MLQNIYISIKESWKICDTEDWSNDAENSKMYSHKKLFFEIAMMYQINAVSVNIKDDAKFSNFMQF